MTIPEDAFVKATYKYFFFPIKKSVTQAFMWKVNVHADFFLILEFWITFIKKFIW